MHITLFTNARDIQPKAVDVTWEQLTHRLREPLRTVCTVETCQGKVCPHKSGPAWSPVRYRLEATRGLNGVQDGWALVIDLDDVTNEHVRQVGESLRERAIRSLIHSSHSDTAELRRMRVVIDLAEPVLAEDWPAFWLAAIGDLGLDADPATKDISRLFYLPSRPSNAPYSFLAIDGNPYSVRYPRASDRTAPMAPPTPKTLTSSTPARFSANLVTDLATHWPAKGRHDAFVALAGALATEGWDAPAITELTTALAQTIPNGDVSKRKYEAETTVAKVERGETVKGWSGLTFLPDVVKAKLSTPVKDFDWVNALTPVLVAPKSRRLSDLADIEFPAVRSYETGLELLDKLLGGGLSTQQMIAVLGPPGGGKSALVISWALHVEKTVPVLYCTTELATNEVLARMAAPILDVSWRDIVRGKAITTEGKVDRAMCKRALADKRIDIVGQEELYHAGDKAISLIASAAQAMKEEFGVAPVIIVDYMQELARGDASQVRQRTTAVAVAFRQMSQALDCSVVLVSAVGRSAYGADPKRDTSNPESYKAAAKESGDIDYAAATILYVDIDNEPDGNGRRMGRIAIAKNRHGDVGFVGIQFHGATGKVVACHEAVEAMKPENRQARKEAESADEMEIRILQAVRERTLSGDLTHMTGTLRDVVGNDDKKAKVFRRLVADEKIMIITQPKYNALKQNVGNVKLVVLTELYAPAAFKGEAPLNRKEAVPEIAAVQVKEPRTVEEILAAWKA